MASFLELATMGVIGSQGGDLHLVKGNHCVIDYLIYVHHIVNIEAKITCTLSPRMKPRDLSWG